jgi:hypothetical protein
MVRRFLCFELQFFSQYISTLTKTEQLLSDPGAAMTTQFAFEPSQFTSRTIASPLGRSMHLLPLPHRV